MKPRCGVGFAAVCARAVRAGIMASSNGRRHGRAHAAQERAAGNVFLGDEHSRFSLFRAISAATSVAGCCGASGFFAHLERGAVDDPHHDGREPVIVCARRRGRSCGPRAYRNTPGRGPARTSSAFRSWSATNCVGPLHQRFAQVGGPADRRSIHQLAGRVDARSRELVLGAPARRRCRNSPARSPADP